MKKCTKCQEEKSLDLFAIRDKKKNSYTSHCKKCVNISNRKTYNSLDKKQYYQENKTKVILWQKNNQHKVRNSLIKRIYGISQEDYNILLISQNNACAICNSNNPGTYKKYFTIDHNHKTGQVRGLLCNKCNSAIGFFQDDFELCSKASQYLLKYLNK